MAEFDPDICFCIDHGGKETLLRPFWSATGYANADFTPTPSFLRMYDYLSSFHGHLHYMRLHNILSLHGEGDRYFLELDLPYGNRCFAHDNRQNGDDKVVARMEDGTLRYNWDLVDQVYDVIVGHGMAPIVELVYLPKAIRKSEEEFFLPADYRLYGEMVRDFAAHCLERYGLEETRGWYFEIWNEPDNEAAWCRDPASFFALYDYMEHAVHSVDDRLRTGGPATMQGQEGYRIFEGFLKHCAGEVNYCTGGYGTRLDFVSVHCKGGQTTDFNPSSAVMFGSVERYLDILEQYPQFCDVEFFNDESDIIWAGSRGVEDASWFDFRNSHYAPGFVCKMISLYCTRVLDRGVNLTVADSDNAHLQWERSLFSGNRSQLTPLGRYPCTDVIKKPFFNAYVLLSKLGDRRLPVQCDGPGFNEKFGVLATRRGPVFSYMLWNFEDGISDMVGKRSFRLDIQNCGAVGSYYLLEYRIDQDHSNSNTLWHKLGCPKEPNLKQIRQLRDADGLEPMGDPQKITADSGELSLEAILPQHAVALFQLTPVSTEAPAAVGFVKAQWEEGCSGRQIFLTWEPSRESDFFHYKVLRSVDGGHYETLSSSPALNTAVYVDMEVESGHRYSYRILAVNTSGIWGEPGKEAVVRTE